MADSALMDLFNLIGSVKDDVTGAPNPASAFGGSRFRSPGALGDLLGLRPGAGIVANLEGIGARANEVRGGGGGGGAPTARAAPRVVSGVRSPSGRPRSPFGATSTRRPPGPSQALARVSPFRNRQRGIAAPPSNALPIPAQTGILGSIGKLSSALSPTSGGPTSGAGSASSGASALSGALSSAGSTVGGALSSAAAGIGTAASAIGGAASAAASGAASAIAGIIAAL